MENHILEQKNLLENERQTSHELKEQIKKIQSQEKKLDEKPKGKSDSNKQQKMVEIIPIQKEELDCVLEAIRLKFLENSLNLISIEKVCVISIFNIYFFKIFKVFSEKFKISVNEKKKNDQELLVKILIG